MLVPGLASPSPPRPSAGPLPPSAHAGARGLAGAFHAAVERERVAQYMWHGMSMAGRGWEGGARARSPERDIHPASARPGVQIPAVCDCTSSMCVCVCVCVRAMIRWAADCDIRATSVSSHGAAAKGPSASWRRAERQREMSGASERQKYWHRSVRVCPWVRVRASPWLACRLPRPCTATA